MKLTNLYGPVALITALTLSGATSATPPHSGHEAHSNQDDPDNDNFKIGNIGKHSFLGPSIVIVFSMDDTPKKHSDALNNIKQKIDAAGIRNAAIFDLYTLAKPHAYSVVNGIESESFDITDADLDRLANHTIARYKALEQDAKPTPQR